MIEDLRLEKEKIIKDIRNIFRLEKKQLKQLKIEYLDTLKNLFEHEEENYCKPVRVSNF